MAKTKKTDSDGNAVDNNAQTCSPAPKWAAVINDTAIPMPSRRTNESVLRHQGNVPDDHVIRRDHNSANDPILERGADSDLGDGNHFYSVPECEVQSPRGDCASPSKRSYFLDDEWRTVLRPDQTEQSIRDLFGLGAEADVVRDLVSPNDEPIEDGQVVHYVDGPVFISRQATVYCVNIEGTKHTWNKPTITTQELRQLGSLPDDQPVVCELPDGSERTLAEDEEVELDPCCRFGRAPKYKRG